MAARLNPVQAIPIYFGFEAVGQHAKGELNAIQVKVAIPGPG